MTSDIGQDPLLGPLQDNGGVTSTYALLPGSPAIDAGDNTLAVDVNDNALVTDQRGPDFLRIRNGIVDIGSFELQIEPDCPPFPRDVGNEEELNNAISCYNELTDSDAIQITLTNNIQSSNSTKTIDNPTSGLSLTIAGNGYTVDGQDIVEMVQFTIEQDSNVTIQNMEVIRSRDSAISNYGTLSLKQVILSNNRGPLGSAIYNNRAALTIDESTVSGNLSLEGGAIYSVFGEIAIKNSTFSDNTAN